MAPRDVEAQEPLLNGANAEARPSSRSWLLFCYHNRGYQSAGGVPARPVGENTPRDSWSVHGSLARWKLCAFAVSDQNSVCSDSKAVKYCCWSLCTDGLCALVKKLAQQPGLRPRQGC